MHMQEGVGRHGYRMLALMFCLLGLLGLGTSLYAFKPSAGLFHWLGFLLEAVAICFLFGLCLTVIQVTIPQAPAPGSAPPAAGAARPPSPGPLAARTPPVRPATSIPGAPPAPSVPAGTPPAAHVQGTPLGANYEFPDGEVTPAAASKPNLSKGEWPQRGKAKAAAADPMDRYELARKYTENAPEVRQILTEGGWPGKDTKATAVAEAGKPARAVPNPPPAPAPKAEIGPDAQLDGPATPGTIVAATVAAKAGRGAQAQVVVPTVVAKVARPDDNPDWMADGLGRGRCGGCDAVLIAPKERPIRLRCPRCDKETVLS